MDEIFTPRALIIASDGVRCMRYAPENAASLQDTADAGFIDS